MRFLVLHGVGSSGAICESQFGPFLNAVDPSYEFIFVDGPILCERGPGMAAFLDGPFFSHTAGYSPSHMRDAQDHLMALIEDLGPFDGVVGFSQGAALVVSYLHDVCASTPPPFKFALLFSCVAPCSSNPEYASSIIESLQQSTTITTTTTPFVDVLQRTIFPAAKHNALLPTIDTDVYTPQTRIAPDDAPRVLVAALTKTRVRIPTVHVVGRKDFTFMRNMSEVARGLCDERVVRRLEHSGTHQPPQREAEVKAAVRAMEWAIGVGERVSRL